MTQGLVRQLQSDPRLSRYLPKIVYVLSSGAAKGFCHVGMLQAMEARDIKPDLVVGTSAGSLIGAVYCHFGNTADLIARIREVIASAEFSSFEKKYFGERAYVDGEARRGFRHFFSSLADGLRMRMHVGMSIFTSSMIAEEDVSALYSRTFEGLGDAALKIPFAAVAVDLSVGAPAVFTDVRGLPGAVASRGIAGPDGLMRAVMASCAIPLVFPTVAIGGHAFVDGSIMANLPIREARAILPDQSLLLAAFDVQPPVPRFEDKLTSLELALRLLDLATRSKQYVDRELADIVFMPLDENYPWSSFSEYESFIVMGRAYMTEGRLDEFEAVFAQKCVAEIGKDANAIRAAFAIARLKRVMRGNRS